MRIAARGYAWRGGGPALEILWLLVAVFSLLSTAAVAASTSSGHESVMSQARRLSRNVDLNAEGGVADAGLSKKVNDLNADLKNLASNIERAKLTKRAARAAALADEERKKAEAEAEARAKAAAAAAAATASQRTQSLKKPADTGPPVPVPAWARQALATLATTPVWPAVCAVDALVRQHVFPRLPEGWRSYVALAHVALAAVALYGAYASVALAKARRRLRAQAKELSLLRSQEAGQEIARLQAQVTSFQAKLVESATETAGNRSALAITSRQLQQVSEQVQSREAAAAAAEHDRDVAVAQLDELKRQMASELSAQARSSPSVQGVVGMQQNPIYVLEMQRNLADKDATVESLQRQLKAVRDESAMAEEKIEELTRQLTQLREAGDAAALREQLVALANEYLEYKNKSEKVITELMSRSAEVNTASRSLLPDMELRSPSLDGSHSPNSRWRFYIPKSE